MQLSPRSSGSSAGLLSDLRGQLLVSHPSSSDDIFAHSVIFIASVEPGSVLGIQLDSILPELTLDEVCYRMDIPYSERQGIYRGGNQGTQRIHVVHSSDWSGLTTVSITPDISITNDLSILTALSVGEGPSKFRACAGHWIWPSVQLENQIRSQAGPFRWIVMPSSSELVFGLDQQSQWRHCLGHYVRQTTSAWYQGFNIS